MKKKLLLFAFLVVTIGANSIAQSGASCTANFTAAINDSMVSFSSSGVYDTYAWTFGDGSTSTAANPKHVYAKTGNYQACLTVKKSLNGSVCSAQACKSVNVTTTTPPALCNMLASFTPRADSIQPNRIFFTNGTAGLVASDSVTWSFGDSSVSHDVSPTHVYARAGNYNVCLTIKRVSNSANCSAQACKSITVTMPVPTSCSIQASFTLHADSIQTNKISFTAAGLTASDSITWSFGEGTAVSHDMNPSYVYTKAGNYTVCLTVKRVSGNATCSSQSCKSITVAMPTPVSCSIQTSFTSRADSNQTNKISFIESGLAASDSIVWSFGDGSAVSHDVNPTHVYTKAGIYSVCLTVKRVAGNATCSSQTCKSVTVSIPATTGSGCGSLVAFSSKADASQPKKITFTNSNSSNLLPTDSIAWTFGDGTVSAEANPTHVYANGGTYSVCLTIKRKGNNSICSAQSCTSINIGAASIGNACILLVSPNPVTSKITLSTQLQSAAVIHAYVYNFQGTVVLQKEKQGTVGQNVVNLSAAGLQPGIYTIKLVSGSATCTSLFLKQ